MTCILAPGSLSLSQFVLEACQMDEVSLDVLVTVIRKDEVAWKTFISVAN